MKSILISDDDIAVRTSLSLLLKQSGYRPITSSNPDDTIKAIRDENVDLAILDMNYTLETTGEEGLKLIEDIRKIDNEIPLLLITAWGSISLAVEGVKRGAADFINKPWENNHLLNVVETTLNIGSREKKEIKKCNGNQRKNLDRDYDFSNIIGENSRMISILKTISQIAKTDASVLITGESGTGKEVIAEAIYNNSKRSDNPFVKVNLGGISNTLFESEMFGHKRGSFTDAKSDRVGRFELADKGTIFLDEIGDLDLNNQVKLLRVLQERQFEILGSSKTKRVDFRLISATNKGLDRMVVDGSFREDLFYRINLIIIEIPSLKERRDDIPLLVNHFLGEFKESYGKGDITIDRKAMDWLMDLPWPGNIRELKNLVERTVLVSSGNRLSLEDFTLQYSHSPKPNYDSVVPAVGSITIEEMERAMIVKALKFYEGNISRVAKSLGLTRSSLYRRLEKYGIEG